jgi:uncharacterized membrane protein
MMMKFKNLKKLFVLVLVIGLMACEQIEKIDKMMDADSAEVANEIAELSGTLAAVERLAAEGESKLLFKASGTEPGWIAEYYNDKFKLVVDYGKDSLMFSQKFEPGGDYNLTYSINENGKEIKLNLKIENKECTDAAGNKKEKSVTVTFNDKVYTGCGENLKD